MPLNQTKAEIIDNAIVIENIYFDFNKATVKKESELSLNKIIEVLQANPDMKIAINAHTDAKGSDTYNMNLSDKRAKAAYEYLAKKRNCERPFGIQRIWRIAIEIQLWRQLYRRGRQSKQKNRIPYQITLCEKYLLPVL